MSVSQTNPEPDAITPAMDDVRFYPMRVVLRLTGRTRMGHHHAATVCQLMKEAGTRLGYQDPMPPAVMPDAVEVGRMRIEKGEPYAFGLMFWGNGDQQPNDLCHRLLDTFESIGRESNPRRVGLGGNFRLEACHSLINTNIQTPVAIPAEWINKQFEIAESQPTLTLRFLSPLCATLPSRLRNNERFRRYFDTDVFPVHDLVSRLIRRLRESIGFDSIQSIPVCASDIRIVQPPGLARLHWIKWTYGDNDNARATHSSKHGNSTKHDGEGSLPSQLYGVMGRVQVRVHRDELRRAIVLGQYSGVGEKTNFGLGRYIVQETQAGLPDHAPRHLRAPRAVDLAAIAFHQPVVQKEANRLNVPVADVQDLARAVESGDFQPDPANRFLLPGEKPRMISVPTRPERVLQRAVYEELYPVLDRFLSDSCFAYRRGRSRADAANRITESFREGWRFALRADFHRFFDSVDHEVLRNKLEVFVQDDAMVDLLMKWVSSGAPFSGRGLPTGAVISPLLANLFLQQFDDLVRQDGGRLIRYGDDFVLLFRNPTKGRAIVQRANAWAEQLKLHLNQDKTRLVQLKNTPFDFLGYRFFSEKEWQFHGDGLTQVEDLNWHEAPKTRNVASRHVLPGEQGLEPSRAGTWIVGPHIDWIGIQGSDVVCRSKTKGTEDRFQRRRVSELIVLGPATIDHSILRHRGDTPLQILIADDIGRWTCAITDDLPTESASLVQVQVQLASDPSRSLSLAQRLIAAKLKNHATIAAEYPVRTGANTLPERLRGFANQAMKAESSEQLLGIEGAAAAAWYGEFSKRIDRRFQFAGRVHPRAADPVNVMLNITQTLLYRLICLNLIREGFAPSIGILHQPRPGHAALASDIQEVFRHLMDRVVIEATYTISPGEFHKTGAAPLICASKRCLPDAGRRGDEDAGHNLRDADAASRPFVSPADHQHVAVTASPSNQFRRAFENIRAFDMSRYVAAYDISSDLQRTAAAKVLLRYGDRLQKSLFEIWLDPDDLPTIRRELGPLLNRGDSFELIPIDLSPQRSRWRWGEPIETFEAVVVLGR